MQDSWAPAQVIDEAMLLTGPAGSIVNAMPFLDLLPGPMPWRMRAQAFRKREDSVHSKLIDEAVTGKASGMNTCAYAYFPSSRKEIDQESSL